LADDLAGTSVNEFNEICFLVSRHRIPNVQD